MPQIRYVCDVCNVCSTEIDGDYCADHPQAMVLSVALPPEEEMIYYECMAEIAVAYYVWAWRVDRFAAIFAGRAYYRAITRQ